MLSRKRYLMVVHFEKGPAIQAEVSHRMLKDCLKSIGTKGGLATSDTFYPTRTIRRVTYKELTQ